MAYPLDENAPLYENIQLLVVLLCNTLEKHHGSDFLKQVEQVYAYAKNYKKNAEETIQQVQQTIQDLSEDTILPLARAFTHFLNLTNVAEQYHRIHRRRKHQLKGKPPQPGSVEAVLPEFIKKDISALRLHQAVSELNIELVLTAHPTEVTRRTLMHKYHKIAEALETLDRTDLTLDEKENLIEILQTEITSAWLTEEIREKKPTAIEEAKWGFAVVEESLWNAVPKFLRDLDKVLIATTGKSLPMDAMPIRFGSWMGGDRDGNPNVTSKVTREVILLARWVAVDLYYQAISKLRDGLSMNECSVELRNWVGQVKEPYRALLNTVMERLLITKNFINARLEQRELAPSPVLSYLKTEDLLEPLMICYRSLVILNAEEVANGELLDVIRRVICFGLSLLPLDIRQDAETHTKLMDFLTEQQGQGSYRAWSEEERQKYLIDALTKEEKNLPEKPDLPDELLECFNTFCMLLELPRDSFGAYIISMASNPSDVLLVALLQKRMGLAHPLRVVPLFETLSDLKGAEKCIDQLLQITEYKRLCEGVQEVMIGYSDSAKDAGYLAASWAQYQAHEALVAVGKRHGIRIVFFHGRGGSAGRGGGPAYMAIRSQPPGSIQGRIRVTQQGEMIRHRFGLQKIAERTLAIYATATLEATLNPSNSPKDTWRKQIEKLAIVSLHSFQTKIKNNSDFLKYFYSVTPVNELDRLTIASRPSKRRTQTGLQSLRAIPWVFAWTQNRLLLPAWLGVGEALNHEIEEGNLQTLIEMVNEWPYFSSVLDMVAMVIAKADIGISKQYEKELAKNELSPLGVQFREAFLETKMNLLALLRQPELLMGNLILARSIEVRSPYLLPLHLLQIVLLKRIRNAKSELGPNIERALLVSISGIAAGMHNTG